MKILKLFFAILFVFAITQKTSAQISTDKAERGIKTEKIQVSGSCDMDKHRIEKASRSVSGVKSAVWDLDSKILTVKYDSYKKNTMDLVQQKVAEKGNDTEKYKASDEAYDKLPECCHYRTLKE
ncbi:heavy-metal-associated domain-containing protein [Flavobacterium luteum]|uniref:Heavy-metal-associated domain-containing protein n=1 Tax=Flavobacterium luteum TaxID=2026654 RepID=A0A7J5AJ04_9FLAO|nr:heavy metal-associated domain-containing protein [Flavobacterium luteum]KAB1157592.1 heavy-metal-associated domain-containing protein [Flavobacterium luteum]